MNRKKVLTAVIIFAAIIITLQLCSYGPKQWLVLLRNGAGGNTSAEFGGVAGMDSRWAKTIKLDGVKNFHEVSDQLYRGAQPTAEGMKNLKAMGIKTVINLRELHSDKDEINDTNMNAIHIRCNAFKIKPHEIEAFVEAIADENNLPAFVHCAHGSDRTGTMCAVYRVVFQNWSKDDAIKEMTEGGFGFHDVYKANLPETIRNLDIDALQKKYIRKKMNAVETE